MKESHLVKPEEPEPEAEVEDSGVLFRAVEGSEGEVEENSFN